LIKLMRDRADPYYIAYALESPDVLKQVERLGAGAGLKHMTPLKKGKFNRPKIES